MVHGYILDICIVVAIAVPAVLWLCYGRYGFAVDSDLEEHADLLSNEVASELDTGLCRDIDELTDVRQDTSRNCDARAEAYADVNWTDQSTLATPSSIPDKIRIDVKEVREVEKMTEDCNSPSTICGGRPPARSRDDYLQFLAGYKDCAL